MTDYYVRKTGNDGNDGTNPDTEAWLTIDQAANTVAARNFVVFIAVAPHSGSMSTSLHRSPDAGKCLRSADGANITPLS